MTHGRPFFSLALALFIPIAATAQTAKPACYAKPNSLTPGSWQPPARSQQRAPAHSLTMVSQIPLPGAMGRFGDQSVDAQKRRVYINHTNAGTMLVFDADSGRVIAEVPELPGATGVLAVPTRHQVFVSASGANFVAIIDDRTLKISARVGEIESPAGIAYASGVGKIFVSNEAAGTDVVLDPATATKRSTIAVDSSVGNTRYDSVSHCILVAAQTKNQLVAIDPATERIVHRYDLPGAKRPRGFVLDEAARLAFISCVGNSALLVMDLRTGKIVQKLTVAGGPDVLAWDAGWRRLYVASQSGVLAAFWLDGSKLSPVGSMAAPHPHTVSVDPRTHLVYVPLESVGGHPVMQVFKPGR